MKIVNLIVTYNRADMLNTVLNKLRENECDEIVIFDNASTDHTSDVVGKFKKIIPRIHYLKHHSNIGGSGGFHEALRYFYLNFENKDYALLHDDDSWPAFSLNSLKNLLGRDSPVHFCCPVIYPQGDLNLMNRPGYNSFLRKPWELVSNKKRRPASIDDFDGDSKSFDYCSFVGYGIKHEALSKVGLPAKEFFIYSDDTAYTSFAVRKLDCQIKPLHKQYHFIHDCNRVSSGSLLDGRFAHLEVKNKVIMLRMESKYHAFFALLYILRCFRYRPWKLLFVFKWVIKGYTTSLEQYYPRKIT